MRESELIGPLTKALTGPEVRVWRQNAGTVRIAGEATAGGFHHKPKRPDRYIHALPPGAADIGGIGPQGLCLQIECKTATGRVRESQLYWREMIEKHGGVYYLARMRKDEDVPTAVVRMVREVWAAIDAALATTSPRKTGG